MTTSGVVPASRGVKRYLAGVAQRLGVADPVAALGDGVLDATFGAPQADPYHGQNGIVPGRLPLELSFAESAPGGLRIALEPLGPGALPAVRRDATTEAARRLVATHLGPDALRWFDGASEPWRLDPLGAVESRGGFLGVLVDQGGVAAVKAYYLLRREHVALLPAGLSRRIRAAERLMPLVPRGLAFGCAAGGGRHQAYFTCERDLDVPALAGFVGRLGPDGGSDAVAEWLDALVGPNGVLYRDALFVELREGAEVQIEVMMAGRSAATAGRVNRLMAARPAAPAWRRWKAAVAGEGDVAGDLTAVALRVRDGAAPQMSVYVSPAMARLRTPDGGEPAGDGWLPELRAGSGPE